MVKRWLKSMAKCANRKCGRALLPKEGAVRFTFGVITDQGQLPLSVDLKEHWGIVHRACLNEGVSDSEMFLALLNAGGRRPEHPDGGEWPHVCFACKVGLKSSVPIVLLFTGTVDTDGSFQRSDLLAVAHRECFAAGISMAAWRRLPRRGGLRR